MGILSSFNEKPNYLDNTNSSLYSKGLKAKLINGDEFDLSELSERVTLIVNTASQCGFTSQYDGLENLYNDFKDKGLMVLGFPSNDFGGQEPGTNEEVGNFCRLNYGVTFPIFEKLQVKGPEKHLIYKFLTEESLVQFQGDPGWNFVKFLVDKKGIVRGRYSSMIKPNSSVIKGNLIKLLGEI